MHRHNKLSDSQDQPYTCPVSSLLKINNSLRHTQYRQQDSILDFCQLSFAGLGFDFGTKTDIPSGLGMGEEKGAAAMQNPAITHSAAIIICDTGEKPNNHNGR